MGGYVLDSGLKLQTDEYIALLEEQKNALEDGIHAALKSEHLTPYASSTLDSALFIAGQLEKDMATREEPE